MSECKHKWIFQETKHNTSRIKGDYYDGYSVTFNRGLDRYYCENCCEIKELKKSEDVKFPDDRVGRYKILDFAPVWY